jgi:hypothetical protein
MFTQEIITSVFVQAPPLRVWAVLTGFQASPDWNPFIRSAEGLARGRPRTRKGAIRAEMERRLRVAAEREGVRAPDPARGRLLRRACRQ